jgi:lipid A 3-O-deacylase
VLGLLKADLRFLIPLAVLLLLAPAGFGQDRPADALASGTWEFAPILGGGSGVGKSSSTRFFYAGGRLGRVFTGEHLPGLLRGDFEWAGDVLPVYLFFTAANGTIYGASVKPVIWQWNFTSGKRFAPYIAAAGGIVFTASNIPPGNTSQVNFTPQFVVGTRIFTKNNRAFFFEGSLAHLSSASLGPQNPGYNASLLFTIGYSWFKHRP